MTKCLRPHRLRRRRVHSALECVRGSHRTRCSGFRSVFIFLLKIHSFYPKKESFFEVTPFFCDDPPERKKKRKEGCQRAEKDNKRWCGRRVGGLWVGCWPFPLFFFFFRLPSVQKCADSPGRTPAWSVHSPPEAMWSQTLCHIFLNLLRRGTRRELTTKTTADAQNDCETRDGT